LKDAAVTAPQASPFQSIYESLSVVEDGGQSATTSDEGAKAKDTKHSSATKKHGSTEHDEATVLAAVTVVEQSIPKAGLSITLPSIGVADQKASGDSQPDISASENTPPTVDIQASTDPSKATVIAEGVAAHHQFTTALSGTPIPQAQLAGTHTPQATKLAPAAVATTAETTGAPRTFGTPRTAEEPNADAVSRGHQHTSVHAQSMGNETFGASLRVQNQPNRESASVQRNVPQTPSAPLVPMEPAPGIQLKTAIGQTSTEDFKPGKRGAELNVQPAQPAAADP